jgi:hypothetical protein
MTSRKINCMASIVLVHCAPTGSPYERKYISMEVLVSMLTNMPLEAGEVAKTGNGVAAAAARAPSAAAASGSRVEVDGAALPPFQPYPPHFYSSPVVKLLLANAVDSWEKLRQVCAIRCAYAVHPRKEEHPRLCTTVATFCRSSML